MQDTAISEKHSLSFQILALTAEIDGHLDPRESEVIKEYYANKSIDNSVFFGLVEMTNKIPKSMYEVHLEQCAYDYLAISTTEEKKELTSYLLKLIKADEEIKISETTAFTLVYNIWFKS